MNTPEIINIEKYTNALNNLLGSDNAYYAGDLDVDAIVEVIMAAKKLENKVKELTEENEKLKAELDEHYSLYFRILGGEPIDRIAEELLEEKNDVEE